MKTILMRWALSFSLAFLFTCNSSATAPKSAQATAKTITTAKTPLADWQATEDRDHPLVGRIWSRKTKTFVALSIAADAIRAADFVALGEVHDNPDIHRIQAWGIRVASNSGIGSGRKPVPGATKPRSIAVVMEMLNNDQQPALTKFFNPPPACCRPADISKLFSALKWKKSGWPAAAIYAPIMRATLQTGGRLYPGSSARRDVRAIGKHGFSKMGAKRIKALQLDQNLAKDLAAALGVELKEGHCGMLPDRAIPMMLNVQRYRDAVLAQAMLRASAKHKAVVLIAGNGHVRTDRAVPWYLARMAPDRKLLSLTILEVQDGENDVANYLPSAPAGGIATDFVIFTPRQTRADQCEELRRMFGKKPAKSTGGSKPPKDASKN